MVKFKIIRQGKRIFIFRLSINFRKGSLKFHLIWNDDVGLPHSHPWHYSSFLFLGAYKEELFDAPWKVGFLNHPFQVGDRISTSEILNGIVIEAKPTECTVLPAIRIKRNRMWSLIKKKCDEYHLIRLYRIFGIKIPALTIGWYGKKKKLCSLCTELGYCRTTGKPL